MSVNPAIFLTPVASQGKGAGASQGIGQGLLMGGGQGLAPGMAFFDLLFGQAPATPLTALNPDAAGKANTTPSLFSNGNGTGTNQSTASLTGEANGEGSVKSLPGLKDLLDMLQAQLTGMPLETGQVTLSPEERSDLQLQVGEFEEGEGSAALIAAGMSPEDITAFMEKLKNGLEQGESFLIGMVKILPPQAKPEMIIHPRAFVLSSSSGAATGSAEAGTGATGGTGNTGGTGAEGQPSSQPAEIAARLNALTTGSGNATAPHGKALGGFDSVLEMFEQAQLPNGKFEAALAGLTKAAANNSRNTTNTLGTRAGGLAVAAGAPQANSQAHNNAAGLSAILGTAPLGESPMLFNPNYSPDLFPEGADWKTAQGVNGPQMTLNGPAMMTSIVTNAPHASHAHPATHAVAATISKAASEGTNKNITLKLNPPELGRVEIRMEFSKDKTAKVHLLAEKQETHLMLQRDSQLLQKALENAGLDASGSDLSFELAQDGSVFDHGSDGRGGQNASGGGSSGDGSSNEEEITVIEASVDWYVDPETGLTRYDILA